MNRLKRDGMIGWADFSWNPLTGCLGPEGEGPCSYCYARRWANRMGDDFSPKFYPERLEEPLKVKKPSRIFCCSMGELFGMWVPHDWVAKIYGVMQEAQQHTFIVLTKWPQNILPVLWNAAGDDNLPLPNVWHLTSVEDQATWDKRIPELLKLREHGWPVLGVSVEPMLGPIEPHGIEKLDWVIVGGMSGPSAIQPTWEWVSYITERAVWPEGISVFQKNNLRPILGENLRQEWPCRSKEVLE